MDVGSQNQRSIAGATVIVNLPQNVSEADRGPRIGHRIGAQQPGRLNDEVTRCVLCCPIKATKDPSVRYGCVELTNKLDVDERRPLMAGVGFKASDIRLMTNVCNAISRALEYAAARHRVWAVVGSDVAAQLIER